jgi:hypothetical protein
MTEETLENLTPTDNFTAGQFKTSPTGRWVVLRLDREGTMKTLVGCLLGGKRLQPAQVQEFTTSEDAVQWVQNNINPCRGDIVICQCVKHLMACRD